MRRMRRDVQDTVLHVVVSGVRNSMLDHRHSASAYAR